MKKIILNFSTLDGWYPQGQQRLFDSLRDPDVAFVGWRGEESLGCPLHKDVPYAFKPYAFRDAIGRGCELAIWFDCSTTIIRSLKPVFDLIELNGYYFEDSTYPLNEWSSDACLKQMKITREEASSIPMVTAGAFGLDLRTDRAKSFIDQWFEYANDGISFRGPWTNQDGEASSDPACKGHRHDQVVASVLAHRLGMKVAGVKFFDWKNPASPNPDAVATLCGI